jgi:hypothetical protein
MIMGDGMRFRLGAGGLIGMGLLALATLPGCSAGQAAEELVPNDGVSVTAPPGPPVSGTVSDDLLFPVLPAPVSLPAKQDPTDPNPGSPSPLFRQRSISLERDLDGFAPAVDAPADLSPPKAAAASPEDRIQRLEERFDALLKELRESKNPAFRKSPEGPQGTDANSAKYNTLKQLRSTMQEKYAIPGTEPNFNLKSNAAWNSVTEYTKKSHRADGETEAVQLTRVTYKLPTGRAEAIAAFFTQNLTDEIEVRVKGDGLQVTASATDQSAIGQFIRLLQTRAAAEVKPPVPHSKTPPGPGRKNLNPHDDGELR